MILSALVEDIVESKQLSKKCYTGLRAILGERQKSLQYRDHHRTEAQRPAVGDERISPLSGSLDFSVMIVLP